MPADHHQPGPELDAAVARDVMRWQPLGAQLWQDRQTGTVYFTGFDPTRVFVPHVVWRPSHNAEQAAVVEQRILREQRVAYIDALIAILDLEIDMVMTAMEEGYPAPQERRESDVHCSMPHPRNAARRHSTP